MELFRHIALVGLCWCITNHTSAFTHDVEEGLIDFLANAESVQERFDVKCRRTSSTELPARRNVPPTADVSYMRYTKIKSNRRCELSVFELGEQLEPSLYGEWCELENAGNLWAAGEKNPRKETEIQLLFRPDPISMLLLTVDSQSNGEGATQNASMKLFRKLDFVESVQEGDFEFGIWMATNRKYILEVGFRRGEKMPTIFNHRFVSGDPMATGNEFSGKYKSHTKLVSTAKIAWTKVDDLFVPVSAELIRGWKGGVYITQYWEFVDWTLGNKVDETRLEVDQFKSIESPSSVFLRLRKEIEAKCGKH